MAECCLALAEETVVPDEVVERGIVVATVLTL